MSYVTTNLSQFTALLYNTNVEFEAINQIFVKYSKILWYLFLK